MVKGVIRLIVTELTEGDNDPHDNDAVDNADVPAADANVESVENPGLSGARYPVVVAGG